MTHKAARPHAGHCLVAADLTGWGGNGSHVPNHRLGCIGQTSVVMLLSRIVTLMSTTGLVLLTLGSGAALADFRLCNNASSRASVAIAYTDGQTWVTEGWWNLKQGACETLLRGSLAAQYYYVYAMDERGGEWKGKAYMCTRDREFRIEGRENCLVRGYDRTGFFEIDTGKDARSWTVQLTDSNQPGQR